MNRMRNLVHWKIMILIAIVIWVGISKVAASADSDEGKDEKHTTPFHVVAEAKSYKLVKDQPTWLQRKRPPFQGVFITIILS